MAIVYVLANQKGGVGKTTTSVSIAACMAEWNQRVLVIDIDPQANATSSLGIDKQAVDLSVYDLLVREAPISKVAVPTRHPRLHVVPSAPALAGATVELVSLPQREYRLSQALAHLEQGGDGAGEPYDYVLIDCPPSLGLLTVNGLTAAVNGVIVPVQCEYLALEGLSQLSRAIELVRRALSPKLQLRGLIMTMYDPRTTLSRQVVEEVHRHFPGRVFKTIIPRSVRLSEAPSHGEPIITYAPRSAGAVAYATLTREILTQDGRLPQQG